MTDLARSRAAKDRWLRTSDDSPIPGWDREAFVSLDYYPEDPGLRFAVATETADGSEVTIETSDGQTRVYTRDLVAAVEIEGETVVLTLYGTPHGLFLPFRDATSGDETYGAGRYLDVDPPAADGTVTIDFNEAYNPYCAYNQRYSCPLPPGENWLTVPIRAGEKAYRRP